MACRENHFGARFGWTGIYLSLALAGASSSAIAQEIPEEELFDLGTLGGLQSGAFQTNADGNIVLGYAQTADNTVRMVVWRNGTITDITPDGALLALNAIDRGGTRNFVMSRDGSAVTGYYFDGGTVAVVIRDSVVTRLTGADFLNPRVISNDGLVVAGDGGTFGEGRRAFYYDAGGLHWLPDLGRPSGFASTSTLVTAINADGSVIVGTDANGPQRAVRWENGVIQDLGVLPDGITSASRDVSADGSVVVGFSNIEYSPGFILPEAFIWQDGVMTGLGFLNNTDEPGNNQSTATAVSGDGSTVIGSARWRNEAGTNLPQGFVWRDGGMQNIGVIPTNVFGGPFATLSAVSFDGHAIVGQARSMDYAMEAFLWRDGEITLLGTLPGGFESYTTDISDDGSIVVGASRNAEGHWRAFIWRSVMQDFTNILSSFGGLAEETELAFSLPRQRLARLEKAGCTTGTKSFCFGLGGYGWRGSAPVGVPKPDEVGIILSAEVRPHRYVSLGANYDWADASTGLARIRADHSKAWSLAARISDHNQLDGPVLEAWYSRSSDQLVLERTAGIPDVEQALGRAKLRGKDYGAKVSWPFSISPRWQLSPSASLARVEFGREAFEEDAADFPADFDRLAWKATRIGAGARLAGSLSGVTFDLGAEVSHELDRGRLALSGRSDIPGAEQFQLESSLARHRTRGEVEAAAAIPFGPVSVVLATEAGTPEYGKNLNFGGSVTLKSAF